MSSGFGRDFLRDFRSRGVQSQGRTADTPREGVPGAVPSPCLSPVAEGPFSAGALPPGARSQAETAEKRSEASPGAALSIITGRPR